MIKEQVTLVYMPGRGIADSIRLLLEFGGWAWDEYNPDSRDDFLALKMETVHGTIPYIRIHGAETTQILEQSTAILKYLARSAGLYPEKINEQYRADMLCSVLFDFISSIASASFASDPVEAVTKLQTDIAPRYLPSLERALSDNVDGDGFCGTSLSFIDLQAFAAFSFLRDYYEDAFDNYPRLHDFVNRIATLPRVASFLQRRFELPDAAYVAHSKSIVVGP